MAWEMVLKSGREQSRETSWEAGGGGITSNGWTGSGTEVSVVEIGDGWPAGSNVRLAGVYQERWYVAVARRHKSVLQSMDAVAAAAPPPPPPFPSPPLPRGHKLILTFPG